MGQEDTISTPDWEQTVEDFEISRETEQIEYEIGDHVVYPHHGAGKVLKKEKKEVLGEKQMYTRAKKILASELMYALEMEEGEAEEHLDSLIADAHAERTGAAAAT